MLFVCISFMYFCSSCRCSVYSFLLNGIQPNISEQSLIKIQNHASISYGPYVWKSKENKLNDLISARIAQNVRPLIQPSTYINKMCRNPQRIQSDSMKFKTATKYRQALFVCWHVSKLKWIVFIFVVVVAL